MLRSLSVLAVVLLSSTAALAARTEKECKSMCVTMKTECEKACRTRPKKDIVESCIKTLCPMAVAKCEETCEAVPKKKK